MSEPFEIFQKALENSNKRNEEFFKGYNKQKEQDDKTFKEFNKALEFISNEVKQIHYELKSDPTNGRIGTFKQVAINTEKINNIETKLKNIKQSEDVRDNLTKKYNRLIWTALTTSGAAIAWITTLYYQK